MFNLSTLEIFKAAWASDLKASRLIEPNAPIRNGPQSPSKLNQWANPLLWIDDFLYTFPWALRPGAQWTVRLAISFFLGHPYDPMSSKELQRCYTGSLSTSFAEMSNEMFRRSHKGKFLRCFSTIKSLSCFALRPP